MTLDEMPLGLLKLSNKRAYDSAKLHTGLDSYQDFLDIIYTRLERLITDFQEQAQAYGELPEDTLTTFIISTFKSHELNAYSDPDTGGHVDIRIDYPGTDYLWLGEAKLDNGYTYVCDGFTQLTTRYVTGAKHQTEGGLLIYIQKHAAHDFMKKTRQKLSVKNPQGVCLSR